MFVIKKLRLNKFVERPIVSNKAMFISCGEKPATIESKDTADCYKDAVVDGASKLKMLGLATEIIAKSQEFAKGDNPTELNKNARDA